MVFSDFDHKKQILVTRFEGDVNLKEILDYIVSTRLNKKLPKKLRIITDSHKSNNLLIEEDLSVILEENKQSLKEFTYIIDAIILKDPLDTAMAYLYKELIKEDNYYFKLFSTYEAAENWVRNFRPNK